MVGIRRRGVRRDGQDDRLIGVNALVPDSRWLFNRPDCGAPAVSGRHPARVKAGEGILRRSVTQRPRAAKPTPAVTVGVG